jgi:hypothetical protein
MIAGVERRQDVRGTVRVACHCVEIDHAVERATAANPLVDGLAFLLLVRVVVPLERPALEGVPEWCATFSFLPSQKQCAADEQVRSPKWISSHRTNILPSKLA